MSNTARSGLLRTIVVLVALAIFGTAALSAHAILIASKPAANAIVKGPLVPITLTFNSRIDQLRSTLTLERPDKTTNPLPIKTNSDMPDKLMTSIANAKPGIHKISWQVLSVDGHLTRGQISFEVQ